MKIRLDELLVTRGLAESRTAAQRLILAGKIRVKNCPSPKAGNRYDNTVEIEKLEGERFVSRGGYKLEGAFEAFALNVKGLSCLDVGASTGGFTDCLLQHGAKRVAAVDVGRNQLHSRLIADPRVIPVAPFNARYLTASDLPFTPDFAVCDVSFISLRHILPPLINVLAPGGGIVTLIKPQFEAGRKHVGKGGVVRDESIRLAVISTIRQFGTQLGLSWEGVVPAPITGPKGNIEYTAYWRKGVSSG